MSEGKHLGKGSSIPSLPDDGVLRLYSMRFCPYSQRIHLVLDVKKIPYHTIYVNLTDKPEWLIEKSPLGKIPALEIPSVNDNKTTTTTTIYESLIIAEYLDEFYNIENKLFPNDPLLKAKDKILIERFSEVISPMYKVIIYGLSDSPGSLIEIANGLDLYEKELNNRNTPYFGGTNPSMLDYMIWPWCERSDMFEHLIGDKYELDKKRFPKLINWRSIMKEDSAVKKSCLTGEEHAKFIIARRAGSPDYDMIVSTNKRIRLTENNSD